MTDGEREMLRILADSAAAIGGKLHFVDEETFARIGEEIDDQWRAMYGMAPRRCRRCAFCWPSLSAGLGGPTPDEGVTWRT